MYYGIKPVYLNLALFEPAQGQEADRFFLRAVAKTHKRKAQDGSCDNRLGQCIERLAYTNPIWAVD